MVGERADPVPERGEVLVKVKACGICGTDVHIFHGNYQVKYPLIPGHELSGEVCAVGEGVTGISVGDRVAVDPNNACGQCSYCRQGRVNLCKNLNPIGVTRDGGFAEYCRVPAVQIYLLPDSVSFEQGALMEPLACALRGIQMAEIAPGDTVAVLGSGTMGGLLLQLARTSGGGKMFLSEPIPKRREIALSFGADLTVNPLEDDVHQALLSLDPDGADVVFEAAGLAVTAEQSLQLAKRGGKVIFFGVVSPTEKVEVSPYLINENELTIRGSFNNPLTNSRALELIASGRVSVEPYISHRFPIEQFEEAFSLFGKPEAFKILIVP